MLEAAARKAADAEAGRHGRGAASRAPPGSTLLQLLPVVLTGGPTRLFLGLMLGIHVARNVAVILDGFISKFHPKLPNDWLDDLVRILGQSLTPLDSGLTRLSLIGSTLLGCAVLLRCKDVLVSYVVGTYVEPLERGQEIVTAFIAPASTLTNWLVILGCVVWLAMHIGVNLQPLLAVGGASSIVIGLATQQVLGNFVSGLNIYLARPFVAGEYISIVGPTLSAFQVSGKVVRVDPMRTLVAAEGHVTVTVPNRLLADCIVYNRSRPPHWSVGSSSPLLASPKELRFKMKIPHTMLDKFDELRPLLETALDGELPATLVRHSGLVLEVERFTEAGAEVTARSSLAWRLRPERAGPVPAYEVQQRLEAQEAALQRALLKLSSAVRSRGGVLIAG